MAHKNLVTQLNTLFGLIGEWSLKHRWLVFIGCLLILFVSGWLSSTVRMNNSFDAYFNESDPAYSAYLQYREDFGSDEISYLLYDASDYEHGVFDLELMKTISLLGEQLENEVPFVEEVKTIANSEVVIGVEDGIDVIELEDEFPETQQALLDFADKFMSKKMYVDGLVSADRKFGAIQVDMTLSSTDPAEDIRLDPEKGDALENVYPQVSDTKIFEILAREPFKNIRFYASGDVPLNSAFNRMAYADMGLTFTLSFVVIGLLLLLFFRGKLIGLLGPLAVVFLSVMMTLAFMGVLGWDMDMMFGMVPTLLAAVGVAHSVHIISEFRIYYARLGDRAEAIKKTLYLVGAPCLLTSLTTAAGFMAMSISPIKTISHMAIYTGFAVLAAFFLSVTLLSFFLSFGKKDDAQKLQKINHGEKMESALQAIAHFTCDYPKQIVFAALLVFVVAGFGISKILVDSNYLLDFNKDVKIRKDTEFIDQTIGGVGSLIYLFDSGEAEGVKNPEFLKELERFQDYIDQQKPLVRKTYSIVELIKDINQSFHGGDPAYYKIPDSRELIAQYLLVYEMSGGEELSEFLSTDYSRANMEVRTQLSFSSEIAKLKEKLDAYQQGQPLQQSTNQMTGIGSLWLQLTDYITESQLKGVALAFVVISALMCFIFRSIKVGMISMIPNIAPSVITVGLIGWMGTPLDYMKLLIAPIAIGIAVDDTIHLMTRLNHEFNQRGNYRQALAAAMGDVGRALLITSVVLVSGFSMFCASSMDSQFWFGILLGSTILIALVADFFVMPALVVLFKPFGPETAAPTPVSS